MTSPNENNNNPSPDPDDNYVYTWREPPEEEEGTSRQLADLPSSFFQFFQHSTQRQTQDCFGGISGVEEAGNSSSAPPAATESESTSSGSTSKSSSDLEEDFIEGDFVENNLPQLGQPASVQPPSPISSLPPHPRQAYLDSLNASTPPLITPPPPHLIWTLEQARKLTTSTTSQFGPSSCGLTSLTHILTSLHHPLPSPATLLSLLPPSLRSSDPTTTPLHTYLISRSRAGTTHSQIITAIQTLTNNKIVGKFFPLNHHTTNPSKLLTTLATWIDAGCAPLATLNPQKISTLADAWHHQMIYGVDANTVLLTNPLEKIPIDEFLPQITSESVLLIKREDVLKFHQQNYDLRLLTRIGQEWNEMNVLGTVSHMLHEEESPHSTTTTIKKTPHLPIPAEYTAGISVFCSWDNPFRESLFNFVI